MKKRLLKFLVCPKCRSKLRLKVSLVEENEIISGMLNCSKCKKKFPIKDSIPRFVKADSEMENFSFEWKKHPLDQYDSKTGGQSSKQLVENAGISLKSLKNKLVLDVGCGTGRFSDVVSRNGGEIIAFDMSYSVDVTFNNIGNRKNVHVVQASVFELPFKTNIFDIIFSVGVLHHTGDTKKAIQSLPKHLKKRGYFGFWVYGGDPSQIWISITNFWRYLARKLPRRILYLFCNLAIPLYYLKKIPLFGYVLNVLIPTNMDANWKIRVLNTYDWLSPTFVDFPRYWDVFNWMKEKNIDVTFIGKNLSMGGIKIK